MSATEQHATQQCKRLTAFPLFASMNADGKREIRDALLRNCQSDEHVTEVITRFLEGEEDPRNPVAALIRIARNTWRADTAPPGCHRCYIGLDESGEIQWAPHITWDMDEYSFAARCDCERGRWFRARDLEAGKPKPPAKAKHEHPAGVDWQRRAAGDAE